MKLTDISVRALKNPEQGATIFYDDTLAGFGVRVSQAGTKSFVLTHGVRRTRETIGRVGILSLSEARQEAKSIDELTCTLDPTAVADPKGLAARIKGRIFKNIGSQITCSIGFAANRLLAKIACKVDKPNGVTIWPPVTMPGPLLVLPLETVPGIGSRMEKRLNSAGIVTMGDLWASQPKHLRALWDSVNGERMWYAIHGYAIHAMPTSRGMFGHGRVLPPPGALRITLGPVRGCSSPKRPGACAVTAITQALCGCGWISGTTHGSGSASFMPCRTIKHVSGRSKLFGKRLMERSRVAQRSCV